MYFVLHTESIQQKQNLGFILFGEPNWVKICASISIVSRLLAQDSLLEIHLNRLTLVAYAGPAT